MAQEVDADLVTQFEARLLTEVGQVLTLFLGHVVGVRDVGLDDGLPPVFRPGRGGVRALDGVAQQVVVVDRVLDLLVVALGVCAAGADLDEFGVEVQLLCLSVQLEEDAQLAPQRGQTVGVVARPLLEHGERASLSGVLLQDDLGDVHGYLRETAPESGAVCPQSHADEGRCASKVHLCDKAFVTGTSRPASRAR